MKTPVARLWHKKGKLEYFCLKQLAEYFPDIEFDFHIVLHSPEYKDEWSEKIDLLPISITWYSTSEMVEYAKNCGYVDDVLAQKIPNFVHFYHILIFHYLRRVHMFDYALSYEYDIIFNDKNLEELEHCIKNKIPFGVSEPANSNCDKALYSKLCELFQVDILQNSPYAQYGINAGFQGMNLQIFDHFLDPSSFHELLKCFNFEGIYNTDGSEKTGWERTIIDTQEQSFHSLMNHICSPNYCLLPTDKYYFYPSYLNMEKLLQSKIIHYFGHTKPQQMIDTIELKLKQYENQ